MLKRCSLFYTFIALVIAVTSSSLRAEPVAPDRLVESLFSESISRAKQEKDVIAKDRHRALELGEEIVGPYVSFEKMSKQILGKYWGTITTDQQQRFTQAFRKRVSLTLIERYDPKKEWALKLTGSRTTPDGKIALVNSEITDLTAAKKYQISYRFFLDAKQQKWMVFDVIVEGVSVLSSFQTAASEEMRKVGIERLIAEIDSGELKTDSDDKKVAN